MRIHAYVLVADPTWLEASIGAYYDHVEKIVVSYDRDARGWTGAPIQVDACLSSLRTLDRSEKIEWAPGDFVRRAGESPLDAETRQRRDALERAALEADWVLQLDTDEVLPSWRSLVEVLERADAMGLEAVEWPARVLFRHLRDGRYLELATLSGAPQYTYPGPIAVRPGAELVEARRTRSGYLRVVVRGDGSSVQVARAPEPDEHRLELVDEAEAIWHNSWARRPAAVRAKIASWGHNQGLRSWVYYYTKWLPSPLTWRFMRQAHMLATLPCRLRVSPGPPGGLGVE